MPLTFDALVSGVPGEAGVCGHCATAEPVPAAPQVDRSALLDRIFAVYRGAPVEPGEGYESVLRTLPSAGGDIDGVVLYSGGKDSSWMLADLVHRGLKVVAWMLDQGYQSPAAIDNARFLCDRLGVDLVIAKPEREPMDNLFRIGFGIPDQGDPELVRSAMTFGSACWPCFATISARATVFCRENDVPFCFVGTHKGQNRVGDETAMAQTFLPPLSAAADGFVAPLRDHARTRAPESADLLDTAPSRTILVPFYEFVPRPAREDLIADLEAMGWRVPRNTGSCSTNCMINELGCQVMRHQYGFDVYQVFEAHERRLDPEAGPVRPGPLDEAAVRRGARLIGLTPEEERAFGLA
ncbi:hypothetical protein [Saccharothrix violaceirubra]|uniref:Phosphoadenosine phosphosulfate reductase family protein n=2 Tax=Saccharothrix violaceirubra TaxID=413306 RepID=A0A7W7WX16_9PSEU|nr:hypothetical protein [Saccharothrix violaceirubra]MBB4966587.1 hypothetical protein [Saccharothrix violaceirubra]